MGATNSKQKQEQKLNRQLHSRLRRESRQELYTLLLLGAPNAGKSTLLNQLNILFGQGFTNQYRVAIKLKIHSYMIQSMRQI